MKPYLLIPKLIEQATWGGTYLLKMKGWENNDAVAGRKIGQTYELFGGSKLATTLTDSKDAAFVPEWGFADKPDTIAELFSLTPTQYTTIDALIAQDATAVLGEKTLNHYGAKMPLLIKLNQALGNSFQLHVPYEEESNRWEPKPETWLYLEDGLATMGVKPGVNVAAYKSCCETIDKQMHQLSDAVKSGAMTIEDARKQAKDIVQQENPWQYVNLLEVRQGDVVDPSAGGIHHSWEEDTSRFPLGNVVFEIQLDAMDPVATIRSFDQGKMKDDGSVRPMNIEDYFRYLKSDPQSNDISKLHTHPEGRELITTPFYRLERLEIEGSASQATDGSFHILHCLEGNCHVVTPEATVSIHAGHSAFVPAGCTTYEIKSDEKATVLVGSVV